MYWSPTETLLRKPCSVSVPPGTLRSIRLPGSTETSWRSFSFWFGRPSIFVENTSRAIGTRSGWATQLPSNPSPASRSLSAVTAASAVALTSASRRLGMKAAMPPIA